MLVGKRHKRRTDRTRIEGASSRIALSVEDRLNFSEDSPHAWSNSPIQEQSVVLWDLKSGKVVWTATEEKGVLVMEFPNGRVRLSAGAEKMVRLVRGFDSRPFDKAADQQYLEK